MKRKIDPAREARRDNFKRIARIVANLTQQERENMICAKHGVCTIEGRSLSCNNMCLCLFQNPACTVVGGFQQWKVAGRQVRKGEHGSMIWVPCFRKNEAGEQEEGSPPGFIIGTVFDISQTDAIDGASIEAREVQVLTCS